MGSTQGTTREFDPGQSLMSRGKMEEQFQTSVLTDHSQFKKPVSPFKLPKKDIVVPDPNDEVVHQRLYEFLRDEKVRRDRERVGESSDKKLTEKIDKELREF